MYLVGRRAGAQCKGEPARGVFGRPGKAVEVHHITLTLCEALRSKVKAPLPFVKA